MLAHVHAVEQQGHQVQVFERRRLSRLELRARPRDKAPADSALARAPTRDLGTQRLETARVPPGGDAHEHLLDHAPVERIGRRHRLKRRQRDFAGRGPDARSLDDTFRPPSTISLGTVPARVAVRSGWWA
jgi:hypothetical protein